MEKISYHKRLVFLVSALLLSIVFFPLVNAQPLDEPPKYFLTILIEGQGDVRLEPDMEGWYVENTSVTLNAVADPDWNFSHWSGDLTGHENPATIIMDRNKTITAHFIQYVDTTPPTVEITKPINALYFFDTEFSARATPFIIQMLTVGVNATDTETDIEKVVFYINDNMRFADTAAPFEFLWTEIISGQYTIKAVAFDNAGNSAETEISVFKWRLHPILVLPLFIPLFILGFILTHRG